MLLVAIIGSLISIVSLFPLRRFLHPLEIITYWASIASFEQLLFTIVTLNLNDVQYDGRLINFWTLKHGVLIINPVVIMWCLAWVGRVRSLLLKLCSFIACEALLLLFDIGLVKKKLLIFSHWSSLRSAWLYTLMILLSLAFMAGYRALMRRENVDR